MTKENRLTNASLSTMWAIKNFPDLNDFLRESRKMGFQKIELNHQVNSEMLSQVSLDHYQFSSVHEPCPADITTRDLIDQDWLISSSNEACRKRGVNVVKHSIQLASQLGAPTVVIHCGNASSEKSDEIKLRNLFITGETQNDGYLKIKSHLIQSRKSLVGPRLQAVKKSLGELLEYAGKFRVKLGLENRYHYMDIPLIDEMDELLQLADSSRLGFVFDVGHAQALDHLGFFPFDAWLKRYSTRMYGCHLHDVIGLTDHYAPGVGEINFHHISHYLPDDSFRTLEVLPCNTLAQVEHSLSLLVKAGCLKYLYSPEELSNAKII
jgi:sugar phosphate isomerase/epimerase